MLSLSQLFPDRLESGLKRRSSGHTWSRAWAGAGGRRWEDLEAGEGRRGSCVAGRSRPGAGFPGPALLAAPRCGWRMESSGSQSGSQPGAEDGEGNRGLPGGRAEKRPGKPTRGLIASCNGPLLPKDGDRFWELSIT